MDNFILIDGNSLINRAFYATPPLSAKDGTPTNAVFAFFNMLVRIIENEKPSYLLVAFDRHEPTFRHVMYSGYKGTRKPMPEALRPQIDIAKDILDALHIARYELAGYEADDIIGTLSKKFDVNSIIITGDKDSFQLVDEKTQVYFTRRGITELDVYDNINFVEKVGITPKQIIDLKSMMGDSSDNIPGIAGVGEKTALNLVQTYGSLENLYENVSNLKGKLKENVVASKEVAFLSKTLATINTSMDIPLTLSDLTFPFPFPAEAKEKFVALEIKNLVKKPYLFEEKKEVASEQKAADKPIINRVSSKEEFSRLEKDNELFIYFDGAFHVYDGKEEYETQTVDGIGDTDENSAVSYVVSVLANPEAKVVVYGKKDLMRLLRERGMTFNANAQDVMIEKYLVNASGKEEKLSDALEEYSLDSSSPARSLCELHKILSEKITEDGLTFLYEEVELPLIDVLFEMEVNGFKIDVDGLQAMTSAYEKTLEEIQNKIYESAGEKFNVNSPRQLAEILFTKLGLPHGKKTKSGFSTNAEALEKIKDSHEIVPYLLRYRQVQKIYSTYLKGFSPLIDADTHLIHTTFTQTLTNTGRLSSKEPNLQNIPIREAEGKEIRKLFIPSFEGGKIVGADYSQIELRLLANLSECEPLIDAFLRGDDIHSLTASQVFGVSLAEVTPAMRSAAKAVNFGIVYGISDFGLASQLKIPNKQAGEYIKTYFERYPEIKNYMENCVAFAKKNGYAKTAYGRKRYIRDINSSDYNLRSASERIAMNMPIQGTAADVMKIAMIRVYKRFKRENLKSKLILQVHDELIVDAAADEVDEVIKILTEEMNAAADFKAPLVAKPEVGNNWYEAK